MIDTIVVAIFLAFLLSPFVAIVIIAVRDALR